MTRNVQLILLLCFANLFLAAQTTTLQDDFEGSGNINTWFGDDCNINLTLTNPVSGALNSSATVLQYHDVGGQYANVSFDVASSFGMSTSNVFSFKIYVPSSNLTGNSANQVSLKLQNGNLTEPWTTQTEVIKPLVLNQWQEVTFDFANDNFINLDGNSPAPILRTDFNRAVIQINGENNNNQVLAYIDDFEYGGTNTNVDPVFDVLVWSDEFNTDGVVNNNNWFHQTLLPDGNAWFNGEVQHYTDRIDNAEVVSGVLKMNAKKEVYTDQGITKQFTSARLNSKFAFQYGRVEIRAKLPFGVGTWPALWTLGKNITEAGTFWTEAGNGTANWPACGEIDIMEHWGNNQNYISSATHTPSSFGGTVNVAGQNVANVSTQFHIYTLDWTAEKLVFKVDGITHFTYNPAIKDANTWPFDAEQFLLFNVAILPEISSTFVESAMEVDYVRVFQDSNAINTNAGTTTNSATEANPQISIESGDIHIEDATYGTIYTSPNGNCFRVTVDDSGNLISTSIVCP